MLAESVVIGVASDEFDSLITHFLRGQRNCFPIRRSCITSTGTAQLRKRNYRETIVSLEQAKKLSVSNPNLMGDINSLLEMPTTGPRTTRNRIAFDEALTINPQQNDLVLNNYSYYLALRKRKPGEG